jgi:hypothetical protein
MNFIKSNLLSLSVLAIYFFWWLYVLFDFNKKVYVNHYAGAVAVEFIGELTALIILVYLIGFLVVAFKTKRWKKYIVFIAIILLPILITLLMLNLL